MKTVSDSMILGAAHAMLLSGCQETDGSAVTSNGNPWPAVSIATPMAQAPIGDPWRVDAAAVFAALDAAEKAKTMRNTSAQNRIRGG